METKTYIKMSDSELDNLVKKYFPEANFEFVADEEMHNDSTRDFSKITKENYTIWSEFDRNDFNKIILGKENPGYRTHLFLEFFIAYEILPEGNYLIECSW